jgi:hypothetical protein
LGAGIEAFDVEKRIKAQRFKPALYRVHFRPFGRARKK